MAEADCLEMTVDVWVRVCCATGVTTAGGEEVVEAEVDGVVDGALDEVVDELEVDVDEELLAEDLDDALDVRSFDVGVGLGGLGLGLGKTIDIMLNCLSWNS